jgi:hypothetical protein
VTGRRPIPSSAFCYDSNNCQRWYDRWLLRGGSVARDTIIFNHAADMPDLRTFDQKVRWARLQGELRLCRAEMRRSELIREAEEARKKQSKVIQFPVSQR